MDFKNTYDTENNLNENNVPPTEKEIALNNTIKPEDRFETAIGKMLVDFRVGSVPRECCYVINEINAIKPSVFSMDIGHDGEIKINKSSLDNLIDKNIRIPISIETIEDISAFNGGFDEIAAACRVTSDAQENDEFFKFLDDNATKVDDFVITPELKKDFMSLTNSFLAKITNEVVQMNLESFKGLQAFCIISPKHIGKLTHLIKEVESKIALGKIKGITFVVNPLKKDDKVYIGLKGADMQSSSIYFVPVTYKVVQGINSISMGSPSFIINHRFGFMFNPLKTKEPLLVTFDIKE